MHYYLCILCFGINYYYIKKTNKQKKNILRQKPKQAVGYGQQAFLTIEICYSHHHLVETFTILR